MRIIFSLTSLIIYLLSYQIIRSSLSCRRTSLNKRITIIASLTIINRINNSASIEDVITINYFLDFQTIGPPNRVNK
jgi:hypothetical protein